MPRWINIPFSYEMYGAISQGKKVCTTRSEKKGEIGDLFVIAGKAYRIVDVRPMPLWEVGDTLYRQEGCSSPAAYRDLWRRLHQGRFSAEQTYYVHWFARIEEPIIETQEADA